MNWGIILVAVSIGIIMGFVTFHSLELKWQGEIYAAKKEGFNMGMWWATGTADNGAIITSPSYAGNIQALFCNPDSQQYVYIQSIRNNWTLIMEDKLSDDCTKQVWYDKNHDTILKVWGKSSRDL